MLNRNYKELLRMDVLINISKRKNSVGISKDSTSINFDFESSPLELVTQQTPLFNTDSHGVSSKATIIDKNGDKSTTTKEICRRRNTWPKLTNIPRQETFHSRKKRQHSGRVKKYIIKKKQKIASKKIKVKEQVSPFLRILPFILAVAGLLLPVADLSTDMASSYRICTADCNCAYINGTCQASHDVCGEVRFKGTPVGDYCATKNETICMSKETWSPPKTMFGFEVRHPLWCRLSIEFLVIPSILNNAVSLISLLYKLKYKRYLITAGLSSLANIHRSVAYLTLTLMAMLQILPYMCMCLRIITAWRVYWNYISKDEDSELISITRNISIIFSIFEDLPQLALQTTFFVRAIVHDAEDGILNDLSWVAVAGLVTSCLSLSKNYTQYIMNLHSSATSPVYIFSTAFIAAGGHVLVCCLMAVGHLHSGYTKHILLPVSTAIAIQISLHFFKLRFSYSGKYSINNMKEKFSHGQSKCKKFLTGALVIVSRIRSILFSAIMDGYSPLGLWSNACYATWALWLKVKFLTDLDPDTDSLSSIGLRWAMILYVINSILVFKDYSDRKNSILVAFLLLIYPIYLCASARVQNKYIWYEITIKHDKIFHEIIITLIPIITIVGLVMLVNILSFIISKLKFQKPASEDQENSGIIRNWASVEF